MNAQPKTQTVLLWGAVLGTLAVFGLMIYLANSAVATDWVAMGTDRDGHAYHVDRLAVKPAGQNAVAYSVQVAYGENALELKGRPVQYILEKGQVACNGSFVPEKRLHLGADQDLLLLENRAKNMRTIIDPALQKTLRTYLCRLESEAGA